MHWKPYASLAALLALTILGGLKPAWASPIAAGSSTAGLNFTMALESGGALWTWGANTSGQLGNGTTASSSTPTQIATGTTFTSVAAGSDFALAIDSNGALWAWGDNTDGQLGYTTATTFSSTPTKASSGPTAGTTWTAVAAGSNFAAAIASDGSLWTWGANTSGQLGYTTATSSSNTSTAPAQAPTPTGAASNTYWTAVAAGSDFVVALRSDNTLWAWGDNTSGQFGNGATGTSSSTSTAPVPGAGGTWTAVSAGSNFVVALRSGGVLWTWGANNSGQLGNNSTTNSSTPVSVAAGTTFSAVSAGSNFALALAYGGALWGWGDNTYGELGNGSSSTTPVAAPVQVSTGPTGSTTWTEVAAGGNFTVAIASDGSIWAWGDNGSGQLGDGTNTSQVSPEEIVSTGFGAAPTVTATVPASGAVDVGVDSQITATFSEAMDPASITTATFALSPATAGTVVYDASTYTASFIPSSDLHTFRNYTATITTGVTDASGNHMASNYTWTFQTEKRHERPCFIATAAYGSYLDPHVAILRAFRDGFLLKHWCGRSFVDLYYRCSPPLARLIARHPALRTTTRWILTPLVYGLEHPSAFGLALPLLCVLVYIRKGRRRSTRWKSERAAR